MSLLYFLAGMVLRPFLRLFARLQATGPENIPGEQGFVIVSNHVDWIDPLWIGLALWPRTVSPMAKKSCLRNGHFASSLPSLALSRSRAAPPRRVKFGGHSIFCKTAVSYSFSQGGTRGAQLSGVKRGAATIAVSAGVPLAPIYFSGPGHLRLRDVFRRRTASIVVGDPIHTPGSVDVSREQRKEAILRRPPQAPWKQFTEVHLTT